LRTQRALLEARQAQAAEREDFEEAEKLDEQITKLKLQESGMIVPENVNLSVPGLDAIYRGQQLIFGNVMKTREMIRTQLEDKGEVMESDNLKILQEGLNKNDEDKRQYRDEFDHATRKKLESEVSLREAENSIKALRETIEREGIGTMTFDAILCFLY
jgi:hypothetical protein